MKNLKLITVLMLILALTVGPAFAETFRQGDDRISFNQSASTTQTSAYTVTSSDSLVNVTCSSADIVITLPTISSLRGSFGSKSYKILKTDATGYSVVVTPGTGDTIGGESTRYINYQNAYIVISTGPGVDWSVDFESPYLAEDYEAGTVTMNADQTLNGDVTVTGETPSVTLGTGDAEDACLLYDGVVDYYICNDDSGDDLSIGRGLVAGTTEAIRVENATGVVTITPACTHTGAITASSTFTGAGDMTLDDNSGASPSFVMTDATNESLTVSKVDSGFATFTTAAADGVQVTTGNLKVGNGTPTETQDGEDAYVEGTLEVDGAAFMPFEVTTATNVLTVAECGKVITLDSTTEFQTTLPLMSTVNAGCEFRFIVDSAPSSASYTIISTGTEDVIIGGVIADAATSGGTYVTTGDTITFVDGQAVPGDSVYMISDGTNYFATGFANVPAGITFTDAD